MSSETLEEMFLRPGSRFVRLPCRNNRNVILPVGSPALRWAAGAFYPAYRPGARLMRLCIRLAVSAGACRSHRVAAGDVWPLAELLAAELPELADAAVMLVGGAAGEKLVVQMFDDCPSVIGYLKCARGAAVELLRREHEMLLDLAFGVGPTPLEYTRLGEWDALLLAPVKGRQVGSRVPVREGRPAVSRWSGQAGVESFLRRLETGRQCDFGTHPGLALLRAEHGNKVSAWSEPLADREWPVVFRHGDLAPWNLVARPDGTLTAIDWESGCPEGFPYFDLVHYVLQVCLLVNHWSADRSAAFAVRFLTDDTLDQAAAAAVVKLSVLDTLCRFSSAGTSVDRRTRNFRAVLDALE